MQIYKILLHLLFFKSNARCARLKEHHKNSGTVSPLSIQGEGRGEGEHATVVVVPFTLCFVLLCQPRHL